MIAKGQKNITDIAPSILSLSFVTGDNTHISFRLIVTANNKPADNPNTKYAATNIVSIYNILLLLRIFGLLHYLQYMNYG